MDIVIDFPPARDLATLDFSDIVAAAYTGYEQPPTLAYPDPSTISVNVVVLHFASDLTDAEKAAVLLRMSSTPNEESIRGKADAALTTNLNWINNTYPQVVSGADAIITGAQSATASTQEKNLARGIKTLADQLKAVSQQNDALIRLALKQFDTTSGT